MHRCRKQRTFLNPLSKTCLLVAALFSDPLATKSEAATSCEAPIISKTEFTKPNQLHLSFKGQVGFSYSVEYKHSILDSQWTTLVNATLGPSAEYTAVDTISSGLSTRFYRVACYGEVAGAEIHASVYATLFPAGETFQDPRHIFLPDFSLYAENQVNHVRSESVSSGVNGWFPIPQQPSGTFDIRWDSPMFGQGTASQPAHVATSTAYLPGIEIPLRTNAVAGTIRLKDASLPYFEDPFLDVHVTTKVSALDATGKTVAGPVRVNHAGEYVLANLPSGNLRLIAEIEGSSLTKTLFAGANQIEDLVIPNQRPQIRAVYAAKDGRGVRSAAPGTVLTVTVEASDPDGDTLEFLWKPTGSEGPFTSISSNTVSWTLPKSGGTHSMYVLARDHQGGFALEKVSISGDGESAQFTGFVCDDSNLPISNAQVSVNGETAQTDSTGAFSIRLQNESNRYVLNIHAVGFELLSRVLTSGVLGGKYRLHPLQLFTVDPLHPIQVVQERTNQPGAQLFIGANALGDAEAGAAVGPLRLYMSTLDLSDPSGRLPGDYGAVNAKGENVRLASYGAVEVQITDLNGKRLNLLPGKTAVLRLPADLRGVGGNAPATIPIWYYDETQGSWQEEGLGSLAGNFYEVILRHFSVINADAEFSNAACMRLVVPSDSPLKLPFHLRVTVPGVGYYGHPDLVSDALSVISRLPANTPIKLEPLDPDGNPIVAATQTVNSGPATGSAPIDPVYPYSDCGSQAVLTYSLPTDNGFLNFVGLNNAAQADAYYHQIDPSNSKLTLNQWKTANGFNPADDSADDANTVYKNEADLGLGRWMHMKRQPNGDVAYYVSNYGTPPNNGSADLAAFAKLSHNPSLGLIATVAMEYSPLPGQSDRFTKFYVFDSSGNRINQAQLDSTSPKFIPKLCIDCHGGNYNAASPKFASKFLPFDVASFGFSALAPSVGRGAQEADFKRMNAQILELSPNPGTDYSGVNTGVSRAIEELIQGWYGNTATPPGSTSLPDPTQNPSFVPTGWISPVNKSSVYSQVIQVSCRTCHAARDPGLDWAVWDGPDPFDGFKEYGATIKARICSAGRMMPNAEIPFRRFWLNTAPYAPNVLANAGLDNWAPTDICPAP